MGWEPENRIAEARFIYGRLILLHVNCGYFVLFLFSPLCVCVEGGVCVSVCGVGVGVVGEVGMGTSEPWHIHGGQRPTCERQISACIM